MTNVMRAFLKRSLPGPVRAILRALLHYSQRLARWPVILWQIRGVSLADELALIRSAFAAPILGLRNLQQWQDPILLQDVAVRVLGVGQFSLRAYTDDLWHVLPWRERSIAELMKGVLKPGDTFIDAGANIGVYTVLASRLVGPEGKVISVEMMPDTAERLESHIHMNHLENVTLIRRALSDVPGKTVTATVQAGKHGQATIATDTGRYGLGREIQVQTTTLDTITEHIPAVRLMKIDVEGAELQALQGGNVLLHKIDGLVYESWGWRRAVSDPVSTLLEGSGFTLHGLDGNNWLAEKSRQDG